MPFRWSATDPSASDIGQFYDIGISTRDGSSLSCLDRNLKPQLVSQIAYMLSRDAQHSFDESTELQEKEKLVQLGTSTAIDREFDQWVQNTQGDWSGGLGQRVYGNQGVINQYFDGEGLLWPLNDWIPQVALRGPTQGLPAASIAGPSAPNAGTFLITPGGALAVQQACAIIASIKAGAGVPALVGVKGAFTQGSNVAVTPPFGQATTAADYLQAWVSGQRSSGSGPANMGETAAATSSFNFSQANTDNEVATFNSFAVPVGGITITSISVYFGGYTAACNAKLCVWNANTGALIVDSASFSCPAGRALRTQSVTPTFVAAGTNLRIGFWRQASQDATWGVAAAGSFYTLCGVGCHVASDATQPTVACAGGYVCGHLQAYVTYTTLTTADITCSDGTWSLIGRQNSPDGSQQITLWEKANCGNAEAAPTWSATAGATPMHAQLCEYSNVALASVVDQQASGSSSLAASITVTNPGIDTVIGDLVVMGARYSLNGAGTATFADSMNNRIPNVHAGDSGGTSLVNHSTFDFGVVPTGVAQFSAWAQVNGTAGGYIDGLGMGYAACYLDTQGPPGHWHAVFFSGDQSFDVDLGANTGNQQGPIHMHIAGGYLWVLMSKFPNTNSLFVLMLGCAYGSNAFVQLRSDQVGGNAPPARTSAFDGLLQASFVGGKLYVAVLQGDADQPPGAPSANPVNALYVLDYSAGTGSVPSGLAAAAFPFPFERGFHLVDLCWQGNQLMVSVSDGFTAFIYQLVAPFTSITTQAVIPGIANALLCTVGAIVFIIAWTPGPVGVNRMELYTLNGGTLTEIPFTAVVPFLDSVTSCVGFGPYAMWAVGYATPGGAPNQKTVTVYAFDVARSRIFRALTFTTSGWTGSDIFGHDIVGVYGVTSRTQGAGATFQAQLGIAIFSGFLSSSSETAREFYWGVQPITPAPAFSGLLQLGVNLISGLFDFTASTNKLFRQKMSHFIDGLVAGSSSPSLTLNAWFDQDPNRLSAVPDFTANTGTPATVPAQPTLDLFEGRIAVKTVYQVISDGGGFDLGSGQWLNAPKIIDVIVAAATGWVLDLVVNLAPGAKRNSGDPQEGAYSAQSDPTSTVTIDQVVAYNFLRQLWREKGGKCTVYLPNGDSYPALIQLAKFSGSKPFAVSSRSDQQSQYQEQVTLKLREDI